MGTSSSYPGPTGRTSLLPPWSEEPIVNGGDDGNSEHPGEQTRPDDSSDEHAVTDTPPTVPWRIPKAALSRWATTGGGRATSFRPVARAYVGAHGGSRQAAESARSGRASTARLAGFLTSGLSTGFAEAARGLGLRNVIGRDAQFVLASLVDRLAPVGALLEEAAARTAMIDTLMDLFDQYDADTGGIAALDALDVGGVERVIAQYVINYVNARFQQELVSRLEDGRVSERRANTLMRQIKAFIASIVRLDFRSIDVIGLDWQGAAGTRVISGVYQAAYALLGGES